MRDAVMEAFMFDRKPVTRLEFGAPGGPCGARYAMTGPNAFPTGYKTYLPKSSGPDRSAVFGKGYNCPKELRKLYEACNRAMLAGDLLGFWLPKELAGSSEPWVIELSPVEMVRASSAEVAVWVADYVSEAPDAKVAQPRTGRRSKVEPRITVSRTVEVERPEPVTAVDAFYPPPAPTVQVVESVVFPEALSAYLGRLLCDGKRQYAEKLARWSLGMGDQPDRPAKDWADDVDVKVARYLGRELVTA